MKNGIRWLLNSFRSEKSLKVANAWQNVFDEGDENIKLIIQDLALYCNFHQSSFVASCSHQSAFNEGARDVFLHILEMSKISKEEIIEIINQK